MKKMYKEIGNIFEYQGVKLQVIETCDTFCKDCPLYLKNAKECVTLRYTCRNCYFYIFDTYCDTMLCTSLERKDGKNVIFKEVQ